MRRLALHIVRLWLTILPATRGNLRGLSGIRPLMHHHGRPSRAWVSTGRLSWSIVGRIWTWAIHMHMWDGHSLRCHIAPLRALLNHHRGCHLLTRRRHVLGATGILSEIRRWRAIWAHHMRRYWLAVGVLHARSHRRSVRDEGIWHAGGVISRSRRRPMHAMIVILMRRPRNGTRVKMWLRRDRVWSVVRTRCLVHAWLAMKQHLPGAW